MRSRDLDNPTSDESQGKSVEQSTIYDGMSVLLHKAPLGKRALAYCVDMAIISLLFYGIGFLAFIVFLGGAGIATALKSISAFGGIAVVILVLFVLVVMLIYDCYFIFFEHKKGGATPGKRLFGMKVISLKGSKLTLGQCVLREVFRHIDCFLGVFPVVGYVCMAMSKRRQRIGDMVANTLVIHSEQKESQSDYMYISQEDYQWIVSALAPKEVPDEVIEQFLTFSYPEFVLKNVQSTEETLNFWDSVVKNHITNSQSTELDLRSRLRFFAEHCFQLKNQRSQ